MSLRNPITLAELSYACRIYRGLSNDDAAYRQFLKDTTPKPDLTKRQHRDCLLEWLNKWGCREFAKEYHQLASQQIDDWYKCVSSKLFPESTSLLSLTSTELGTVEDSYNELVEKVASKRTVNEKEQVVKFGPVGASKILFALRPKALIAWDNEIRQRLKRDGSSSSYRDYLQLAKERLNELSDECQKHGIDLKDLPDKVERPKSSLAKLIDEYLWVTVSRGCKPPDKTEFERWVEWS